MLFSTACPARPKKATPSWISAAVGRYLSRKMSASGCPVPITGASDGCRSPTQVAISCPSWFVSAIARA